MGVSLLPQRAGATLLSIFSLLGLALAAIGLIIGTGLAMLLSRLVCGFLFGVRPVDPVTFGAVATILAVVSLVASYVPARRATRVDPLVALRDE